MKPFLKIVWYDWKSTSLFIIFICEEKEILKKKIEIDIQIYRSLREKERSEKIQGVKLKIYRKRENIKEGYLN